MLMMLSEAVMVESEPYSKIGRTHCFYIWIRVAALGPHFLLASSRKQWYPWLQCSKTSSKCFWKVSFELKIMPKNFT